MSSWFGGSNKKNEESSSSSTETGFMDQNDYVPYSPAGGGGGGGNNAAVELQQFTMALQQQMAVHQVIGQITEKAFSVCVPASRDNKLSGKEVACIHSVTNKWLDCNEFMMGRLARKAQQQAGGSGQQQFG